MTRRSGFTLIETLMAIVIVAMLVLIGFPKVSSAMVKTNVRGARTTLANMFTKARTVATQTNRKTRLKFNGNQVWIVASPRLLPGAGTVDTIGPVENLNTLYGVTVTSPVDSVTFERRSAKKPPDREAKPEDAKHDSAPPAVHSRKPKPAEKSRLPAAE